MAPSRIIADSDDSEDEFGLGDSPLNPAIPKTSSDGRSSDPASVATGSTDPKFFQAIYTEQQRTATHGISTHPERSSASNGATPSSLPARVTVQAKKDDTNTSSLTSITDPVMYSSRAKKARKAEVVDLTQITTPGRGADPTPRDMWDVPSSPVSDRIVPVAIAKNRTPESNKKRKRVNNVEFTSPLAVELPSQGSTQPFDATPAGRANTTSLATKRRRTNEPESSLPAEDDVDMVIIPRSAGTLSFNDLVSAQIPVSLYIEPQTLSASQRLEYEYRSVDPSPEDQWSAPAQQFVSHPAATRSSGATTIAYSTPSQTRVIGGLPAAPFTDHTIPNLEAQQLQGTSRAAMDTETTVEIQSSPDIISAATTSRQKNKPHAESPRASELHQADDSGWGMDEIGVYGETYNPRTNRFRGGDANGQDEVGSANKAEIPVADMGPAAQLPMEDITPVSPPKPKKRGRPKKSEIVAGLSAVAVESLASPRSTEISEVTKDAAAADTATAATQQTKKKRGRPRKADKAVGAITQQESEKQHAAAAETVGDAKPADPAMDATDASDFQSDDAVKPAKGKQGGKKQGSTADVGTLPAAGGPQERGEARVLQAMTPNTALKSGSDGLGPHSEAAASDTPTKKGEEKQGVVGKAGGKQGLTMLASSQAGKPIFRVGLSRKSRIAPLLKSLRK